MSKIIYLYGVRANTKAVDTVPAEGFIDKQDDIMGEYVGVLAYGKPLRKTELEKYGLDYIGARRRP